MNTWTLPKRDDVVAALARIRGRVDRTPLINNPALDRWLSCEVWLKCEHLQPTGAFKIRGATNAVTRLSERGHAGDVATHSSGNHGAALALAATRDGRQAHVVMPRDAVPKKIEAVRRQGGKVVLCEPGQAPREAGLTKLVTLGLEPIPPYDHFDIIAGQGTAALELLEQAPGLDDLITPLGGGGLIAGCAVVAAGAQPSPKVYGAEPEGAADTAASLRQGRRVESWKPDTVADGLRALVGKRNFAIIQQHVHQVLTADDESIISAMRKTLEHTGQAIEPSSAVALAVIAQNPERFSGRRVGVIVTGGNIDTELFPWAVPDPEASSRSAAQ